MAPANLQQGHTYLRITTSNPSSLSLPDGVVYVGPVGELPDEHVFEVTQDGQAVDPAGSFWSTQENVVLNGVKRSGVSAQVLAPKQRAKRDEF